jgi:hypothetical protein
MAGFSFNVPAMISAVCLVRVSGLLMITSNPTFSAFSARASCRTRVMPVLVSGRFESSG